MCFSLLKADDLKCYLGKVGDRIAVIEFCKNVVKSKDDANKKEQERLEAVERFLSKRKTSGDCDHEGKSKKSKAKEEKTIEKKTFFGWVSRSKRTFPYTSVGEKISGGVKNLLVPLNVRRDVILEKVKNHFFRNGMSKKGHIDNFEFDIVDKTHEPLEDDKTFGEILQDRAYKNPIFFLATTDKEKRDAEKVSSKFYVFKMFTQLFQNTRSKS